MTEYIWNSRKPRKKVHIRGSDSLTRCKVENMGPGMARSLNARGKEFPEGRKLCHICKDFEKNGSAFMKPDRRKRPSDDFYQSWEWASLRFEVLRKYGAKCMLCGATSETSKIVVDHIKPRRIYPELELSMDNLQVLCDMCNRGKGGRREVDFRDRELEEQVDSHMRSIMQDR